MRNVYCILVGKPEGKRQLGGPKCRREENLRLDLRKIRRDGVDWICRALVNTVMNLRFP
jgi:hypothetical protein